MIFTTTLMKHKNGQRGVVIEMSQYALQAHSLSKSFGKTEILHGIDLAVGQGEVYGLIGENGA